MRSSSHSMRIQSPEQRDKNRKHNRLIENHHHYDNERDNLRKYTDYFEEDEEFYIVGERVLIDNCHPGSVAYFGETGFAGNKTTGGDWVGVVLDEPIGAHDGKHHGREYFQCAPNHGLFVRPHRVGRLRHGEDSALGSSSANSSRIVSPASGRPTSVASSYFYDEDYRQQPGLGTLERRLKSDNAISGQQTKMHFKNPPQGILKLSNNNNNNNDNNNSGSSMLSSKVDELNKRLAEARSPTPSHQHSDHCSRRARSQDDGSVFNFRPKREPMRHTTTNNELDGDEDFARRRTISLSPSREPPRLGERVRVRLNDFHETQLRGVLRFMGETRFATGEWAGVELDEQVGKNDGSVLGERYFYCAPSHGIFVPATRVKKLIDPDCGGLKDDATSIKNGVNQYKDSFGNFGTMRSTIKSPPPLKVTTSTRDGNLRYGLATPSHEISSSRLPYSSPVLRNGLSSPASASPSLRTETPMSTGSSLSHGNNGRSRLQQNSYEKYENTPTTNNRWSPDRSKFDERDIELELTRSLHRRPASSSSTGVQTPPTSRLQQGQFARPKAVTYTFTSSKYDGNPIAKRTLIYE